MGEREQAIRFLTQLKRDKLARRETLLRPLHQLDKEIEGITITLGLVLQGSHVSTSESTNFPLEKLRGLSHKKAVLVIARQNGGVITAQDAKRIMIQAGVLKEGKNSTHMVHNAIISSEKFDRVGRGEYRLKNDSPLAQKSDNPASMLATGHPIIKSPLQ